MARLGHGIVLILFLTFSAFPSIRAQNTFPPYIQVTLDKSYYYSGDVGRLMIDIRNTAANNIVVYNVTIIFPWRAYINGHWDGNQTIQINKPLASGDWLPTITVSFTVPSDSRYGYYPYYFPGNTGVGTANVWVSSVGNGGAPGVVTQNFAVGNAYYFGEVVDWHNIFLLMIVMTVLLGVIAGSVLFYVYSGLRRRQVLHWGSR